MSNALDDFERSLVNASRMLNAQATVTPLPTRRAALRRVLSLGIATRIIIATVLFATGAGGAVAAYVALSDNTTKTLAEFECEITNHTMAGVTAVTGDPAIDCAAAWPQASGGQHAAPPLTMWGTTSGKEVAVARPTALGPEPSSKDWHWKQLPAGWTVNLPVVEITDQLSNITVSFTGNAMGESCTRLGPDTRLVRSLLDADGLSSWTITAVNQRTGRPPVSESACRTVLWIVNGASEHITLLQGPAANTRATTVTATQTVTTSTPTSRAELTIAAVAAQSKLRTLYTSVNAKLSASCQSVPAAARLWTQAAAAAGFVPTTLAYWHRLNTKGPTTAMFNRYTLFQQPRSQHTGSCAHVLVMIVPGSGITNVYAARITP